MADTETLSLFDDETMSAAPKKKKSKGRGAATTGKAKAKTRKKGKSKARAKTTKGEGKARAKPKPKADAPAEEPAPRTKATNGTRSYQTAQTMATKQREISVSEFFAKNRHMLGFDSPSRAILTAVKEAVDNSLDACEEAGILPDILVEIKELSDDRYRLVFQDSGPGIVKAQIPKIFGKLLYGSKFHQLKQTRGQQGIGISAAVMYAQLTTGKPVMITSRTGKKYKAHRYELQIDTKKNAPQIVSDSEVEWDLEHGTRVEMEIEATYKKGKRSVDQFMHQVALANPHADIHYIPPKGDPEHYERVTQDLPPEPIAIKPHPHGVELGIVMDMLATTKARTVTAFLSNEFSRMSARTSQQALELAGIKPRTSPKRINRDQAEAMLKAFSKVKIMKPPTNCLSPMGEEVLRKSMEREYEADFYDAVTRPPAVYRGNPFQIEVAVAYGVKDMPADELVQLYRFANRAPLIYQQNACALTSSVVGTAWKGYGLNQSKGALPTAAMVIMVQIESVWVPFTSESKEAVAHYPEIIKETKLALQECGRRLARYIRKGIREREEAKKRSYIEQYIPHIGIALKEILGISDREEKRIVTKLTDTLEKSRKL
jgi:DNA topoisomerase-6 subunit B